MDLPLNPPWTKSAASSYRFNRSRKLNTGSVSEFMGFSFFPSPCFSSFLPHPPTSVSSLPPLVLCCFLVQFLLFCHFMSSLHPLFFSVSAPLFYSPFFLFLRFSSSLLLSVSVAFPPPRPPLSSSDLTKYVESDCICPIFKSFRLMFISFAHQQELFTPPCYSISGSDTSSSSDILHIARHRCCCCQSRSSSGTETEIST